MGHRSSFSIKLSFGIGQPPAIYQMECICVGEGSRVPNLQTEFNYLDSFKSYWIFSDLLSPGPRVALVSSPHHLRVISVVSQGNNMVSMVPVVPTSSPWSLHCPRCPCCLPRLSYPISSSTTPGDTRVIPMVSALSLHHLCIACVAPRWSPCI